MSDEIKVSTKGAIEINWVRNLDVEVIGGWKLMRSLGRLDLYLAECYNGVTWRSLRWNNCSEESK